MPSACISEDAPSETLLTKSSNGMANLVYLAMANATRAKITFLYSHMIQLIVLDKASKPSAAKRQT